MRLFTFVMFIIFINSYVTTSLAFDVNGDGQEGLAESIHALQVVAGLNPSSIINCTATDEVLSLGKCWKDRNLGANRVATGSDDSEAYGDLYQWGRLRDGHQHRTSGLETIKSVYDDPEHDDFIPAPDGSNDWRDTPNDILWQGMGGINNPCPQGFRIPTADELNAEMESWGSGNQNRDGAFGSPLKLPAAGWRVPEPSGAVGDEGALGYYWSSTTSGGDAHLLTFNETDSSLSENVRALGCSVRCIKDLDYSDINLIGNSLGEACTRGIDCLSGNCVDGVCCNSSCDSICESCVLPGSIGLCGFIPFGNDPSNECSPGTCDGTGVCVDTCTDLIKNLDETDVDCGGATCETRCDLGQDCEISTDCASTICIKGVCS